MLAGWKGPVLVDGTGAAYAAVALRRMSLLALLRPRMLRAALAARKEGFRQGRTQGDAVIPRVFYLPKTHRLLGAFSADNDHIPGARQ